MKRLVFISLGLFLVFLHPQNLLKAETAMSYLEGNPNLVKIIKGYQNNNKFAQDKIDKIIEKIKIKLKIKLMCICNFAEKLELLKFQKDPILSNLFGRLFTEFNKNIANLLNTDFNNFNKSIIADKTKVENLANKILIISSSNGNKLDISISLVMAFLKPSSNEPVDQKQIKQVLIQTLSILTSKELDSLQNVINSNAFVKIMSRLDELTEIALSVLMEEDTKSIVK